MKNKDFVRMILIGIAAVIIAIITGLILSGPITAFLITCLGLVLIAVFSYYTDKRYKALARLNIYLDKVLAGDDMPSILDQEEGELSILKTNIYKATTTLNNQKELLAEDKLRMANAIADISHQLKTPLTSMMVMNDLLKTEEDADKRKEFLNTQSTQLDRMNWLIQTLLKLSKLDAGTIELKSESILDKDLILEALKPFDIQMDLRGISNIVNTIGTSFKCDKNWTIEAIQNIIKNCIEHMESGGTLTISSEDTNIYNQIIIADMGCGIAKEDLPHIFERFYKGKNAIKDSVGIGLALAKSIIISQHGDILVESQEGIGTKFFIRFYKTLI